MNLYLTEMKEFYGNHMELETFNEPDFEPQYCSECNDRIESDKFVIIDGSVICPDCYNKYF